MKQETKRSIIEIMLNDGNDYSYDLIALRADCSISYVKQVEKEISHQKETKRPLYKVLNEKRSSENTKIAIPAQSDYTELAVNNLHHLAEALKEILWAQENMGTIKNTTALYKAKEALARIS